MQVTLFCPLCRDRVPVVCAVDKRNTARYIADVSMHGHSIAIVQGSWRPDIHSKHVYFICQHCGWVFAKSLQQLQQAIQQDHKQRLRGLQSNANNN